MTGWLGGVQIRRMERGQTPVVDFLCTLCGHHRRATGRELATDFLASDPITQHRDVCPANPKDTTR